MENKSPRYGITGGIGLKGRTGRSLATMTATKESHLSVRHKLAGRPDPRWQNPQGGGRRRLGFMSKKRPPPWFWNGDVLAQVVVVLLAALFAVFVSRLLVPWSLAHFVH